MEFLKELRMKSLFLRFAKDPTKTDLIFKISDLGRDLKRNAPMISEIEMQILKNQSFKAAWDQRWIPSTPTLDELSKCPKGSLGYSYFDHLRANNLKINFYPEQKPNRVIDYLSFRLYHAHDLWHVALGYPITPQGEIEVQAFTLAQIKSPTSVMLITGGFLNLLDQAPDMTPNIFSAAIAAYNRGSKAEFLLGIGLEDLFNEPLDKIKELAKI